MSKDASLTDTLRGLLWSRTLRHTLQRQGINVVPSNFYSNIPSIDEVEESFEYATDAPPYLDERVFDAPAMQSVLRDLVPHAADFAPGIEGDEAACTSYFWNNTQF